MLKYLTAVASTAIIVATLAGTTTQARPAETDRPKCERVVAQKLAKAHTPYFWLVLGVGY